MDRYKDTISLERLNKYKINDDLSGDEIIQLYLWNLKLSEAIYPSISMLEVALRNKMNYVIANYLNNPIWLYNNIFFGSKEIDAVNKVLNKLKLGSINNISIGSLIAELNFGFWVGLLKRGYRTILWDQKGVFEGVFNNYNERRKNRVGYLHEELKTILKLRNRVAHHEKLIFRSLELDEYYKKISKILNYISNEKYLLLKEVCRFNNVYIEYKHYIEQLPYNKLTFH